VHLEIISRVSPNRNSLPPLLFVHGAFGGAWMWDEHFLPYFAQEGWEAHALSLRGHGQSKQSGSLHRVGLNDYVEDLSQAVQHLGVSPVLVGHSLGGVVVQKWLKQHTAAGAVLMGSGPPHGMLPCSVGMWLRNPLLVAQLSLAQAFGPSATSADATRKSLFSDNMPAATVARHFARSSPESLRVGFELAWPDFPGPRWNREMPILVLGAENDFFVSPTMVKATAEVYGARAEIIPDLAHAMMLERNWQVVADRILSWLQDTSSKL